MRAIISPDLSDLFAVLAQVASALAADPPPSQRPQRSRLSIHSRSTSRQPLFLDFVPQHDVTIGVRELAREKLTALLCPIPDSLADAVADLGQPEEIARELASCQRSLCKPIHAA
jgi:hypothetical protein